MVHNFFFWVGKYLPNTANIIKYILNKTISNINLLEPLLLFLCVIVPRKQKNLRTNKKSSIFCKILFFHAASMPVRRITTLT